MTSPVLFSSKSDLWSTPQDFFAEMERRFGPFDLDVCATTSNAKCPRFFSPKEDGLKQPWRGRCWMNPPFGRPLIQWVRKAWESSLEGAMVVCLLPVRTDTKWWHDYVKPHAATIEFVRGRLRFGGAKYCAPFASAVVVFAPRGFRCRR